MTLTPLQRAIKHQSVTLTLRRESDGSYVDGRWQNQGSGDSTFAGSIQVLNPAELQREQDSRHKGAKKKLYTQTELHTVDVAPSSKAQPDVVVYKGVEYHVEKATDWDDLGGYYKYILTRMEGQ